MAEFGSAEVNDVACGLDEKVKRILDEARKVADQGRRRWNLTVCRSLRPRVPNFRSSLVQTAPRLLFPYGGNVTKSNKDIVLEVLRRSFVERDPTVVEQYFGANYKQHNPVIADGPSAIAKMIPTLTGLTYEPGMAVADGDLVMVHGRYTGWGPKPMVAVDIFRIVDGKVVEHWDVMQEEVPAASTTSGNAMFTIRE
jgi:predicted SnoaL-like aldol condensation-catalyzing enzyme